MLWPSIIALLGLYLMVYVGILYPIQVDFGNLLSPKMFWVVFLLLYAFIASSLPVWQLLQPRDLINSHQLFVGLFLLLAGIFILQPEFVAPAFNTEAAKDKAVIPFLFVTIACGAISGFHGLVSSGTTSKQVARMKDARMIGYGGMLGEGLLALIATLAVSAGISDWHSHYHSFASAAKGGVKNFVEGASSFIGALGVPEEPSKVVIAVLVISFAATSLDTAVRIQRYIFQELGEIFSIGFFKNRFFAGLISVLVPLGMLMTGSEGALWPLFGASNQVLAGLSLLVITIWLLTTGRKWHFVAIPAVFVILVSCLSLFFNLIIYFENSQYLLLMAGVIIITVVLHLLFAAFSKLKSL